ncbi:Dienelactone hydrolase [Penicillium waksmanii]|uniref:Dienelactone hydrolase n=1 Tax=Penicillium waksmanii TaxID=69791 RepID=UPI002546795D|nr:Dienelactone hydrolase [Penicillium waksmanii]KAJ5987745.1 Dienelactone hydrolase [Penicillium waksmanii]
MPPSSNVDQSNTWLAQPSGPCCLEGTLHEGTSRGRFITVAGVETYIVKPKKSNTNGHILLYFPDVWGMFPNGLLVMDAFADSGYLVLGLDYFRGDPVWKHRRDRHDSSNPDFDYEAWKRKHMSFADEAVPRWIDEVKSSYGQTSTKYACVGYCFGAPYVCDELAKNTVSAGAFAHPAFLKDSHFSKITKPLFLSCSVEDHTFPLEARQAALDILEEGQKTYQFQMFSGVSHGFALRGNMKNPYERKESFFAIHSPWILKINIPQAT